MRPRVFRPSPPSIRMSSKTTSGLQVSTNFKASAAEAASPQTSIPDSWKVCFKPTRTTSWSSTIKTRVDMFNTHLEKKWTLHGICSEVVRHDDRAGMLSSIALWNEGNIALEKTWKREHPITRGIPAYLRTSHNR